jgi:hypothetical protein
MQFKTHVMKAKAVEVLFSRGNNGLTTISMDWEHSVIYTAVDIEFCEADGGSPATVIISWEESQRHRSITVPVDRGISTFVGRSLPVIVFVFEKTTFEVKISVYAIFSSFFETSFV